MKALILAAGYGTRLYPLTLDNPKPLLKIGDRTILDRIVDKLSLLDEIDQIYIVTNQKFFETFCDWQKKAGAAKPIKVINDGTTSNEDRMGAIGDINLVITQEGLDSDLLVIGGDNLFAFSLGEFAAFARSKGNNASVALYDVGDLKLASQYGIVSIDKKGKVTDFSEKPKKPASTLAAVCIYYFPSKISKWISEYISTNKSQDAPGNLLKWLAEKEFLFGCVHEDGWYDIGDMESYKAACKEYGRKR